jgi:cytoskeletal protein RodZ
MPPFSRLFPVMTIEGLGKKFQDARLARGLTLDEAARLTKIRPSRLAEIEADDFSQFPSLAYAKGFLQIYGKFLDVDVTPYLDVFETPQQVTVDGYSYLQDQPAPKPRRIRPTRAPVVRRERPRGQRSSPWPVLIAIGVIIAGFMLMRLILKIEQISSTPKMVGVPQPTAAQSAGPPAAPQAPPQQAQQAPPAQVPQASLAPAAPSRAPSPAPIAVAEKKSAQPSATVPASITPPEAFVPAFANASAAAKANVAPSPKQPEVRRAEPVRPEDLAKATGSENSTEATGPNRVAIKPLKKTYIKVVVDNESKQPAFERWISPSDGTVEFRGQKISVRVLDRDAIRITKNGKPVSDEDDDVSVE